MAIYVSIKNFLLIHPLEEYSLKTYVIKIDEKKIQNNAHLIIFSLLIIFHNESTPNINIFFYFLKKYLL